MDCCGRIAADVPKVRQPPRRISALVLLFLLVHGPGKFNLNVRLARRYLWSEGAVPQHTVHLRGCAARSGL